MRREEKKVTKGIAAVHWLPGTGVAYPERHPSKNLIL